MLDLDKILEQAPPGSGRMMHLLEALAAAGEPITLSINGKGNLPVLGDGAFQILFTLVERLELAETLRERLAELDAGAPTYTMEEVRAMIGAKHGIPA